MSPLPEWRKPGTTKKFSRFFSVHPEICGIPRTTWCNFKVNGGRANGLGGAAPELYIMEIAALPKRREEKRDRKLSELTSMHLHLLFRYGLNRAIRFTKSSQTFSFAFSCVRRKTTPEKCSMSHKARWLRVPFYICLAPFKGFFVTWKFARTFLKSGRPIWGYRSQKISPTFRLGGFCRMSGFHCTAVYLRKVYLSYTFPNPFTTFLFNFWKVIYLFIFIFIQQFLYWKSIPLFAFLICTLFDFWTSNSYDHEWIIKFDVNSAPLRHFS